LAGRKQVFEYQQVKTKKPLTSRCGDGHYFLIIIIGLLVVIACSLPNQIFLTNKTLCLEPWRFINHLLVKFRTTTSGDLADSTHPRSFATFVPVHVFANSKTIRVL
jgi:hypothetical protein